jgi:hypothetical protein
MVHAELALALVPLVAGDTDGDGLSDFQEVHKYRTDPASADSDGDGVPDGDWRERREYAYTVRSIVQVLEPYHVPSILNDDYQDARVLDEREGYVELEVVHYPLNTCADAIEGITGWRERYAHMQELRAGTTTNWDAELRDAILAELAEVGIDPYELTDAEAVRRISKWACDRTPSLGRTAIFSIHFPEGRPAVHPELKAKFEASKGDPGWTDQEHFQHELYGKGMFENRTRGTCTTSATYLTTVLRAVGIPTRMIVTIPVVDASDPANRALVGRLRHARVRRTIEEGLAVLGTSFAAHTYNEVFVGDRWRRLNDSELGQNTLDAGNLGLMTHVHTFHDLAEAGLGDGWGARHPWRRESPVFRHSNPYTALTLSDQVGVHSGLDPDELATAEEGHRVLTINDLMWFDSDRRPADIRGDWSRAADPTEGHLLVLVNDLLPGQDARQYRAFHASANNELLLRSPELPGAPDVRAYSPQAWWVDADAGTTAFYLSIPGRELMKMRPGIPYHLVPQGADDEYRWAVAPDLVALVR